MECQSQAVKCEKDIYSYIYTNKNRLKHHTSPKNCIFVFGKQIFYSIVMENGSTQANPIDYFSTFTVFYIGSTVSIVGYETKPQMMLKKDIYLLQMSFH